jgi:hypothetical protein
MDGWLNYIAPSAWERRLSELHHIKNAKKTINALSWLPAFFFSFINTFDYDQLQTFAA